MHVKMLAKLKDHTVLSKSDERAIFDQICQNIIEDPRKYLENLENLNVFEFSFISYDPKRKALRTLYTQ